MGFWKEQRTHPRPLPTFSCFFSPHRAEVARCEKPKTALLAALGPALRSWYDRAAAVEVLTYAPTTVATVDVTATHMREAASKGFRSVAGFIFGGNEPRAAVIGGGAAVPANPETDAAVLAGDKMRMGGPGEKVAMTSPVIMHPPVATGSQQPASSYTVQFVMPSKYGGPSALPIPSNPNVRLASVPSLTVARVAWRGGPRPDDAVVAARMGELETALAADGRWSRADGVTPPRLLGYYPPFAPRWQQLHAVEVGVVERAVQ